MLSYFKYYFSVFFIWGCYTFSFAQTPYLITHLDNTYGLSNNSVRNIFQDSDRLLWISTADGLNVYNGSTFQLFKSYDPASPFSLPDNAILNVLEDKNKQIWICTEKGVTSYNKENGLLQHYFYNPGQRHEQGSVDYFLSISPAGLIVAGLRLDSTLYAYDGLKKNFFPIKFDVPSTGKFAEIGFDDSGRLWTLSLGGAIRIFSKQGEIFHQIAMFIQPAGIHLFYMVNHQVFVTNGDHQLYEITKDNQLHALVILPRLVNSIAYFKGHYFVSYLYKGIQEFDAEFKPVENILKYFPQARDVEIASLLATDNNVLWASTSDQGIFKIVSNKNNFGTINKVSEIVPINSPITTFAQVNNELWVGTKTEGIIKYSNLDRPLFKSTVINPVSSFYDPSFNSYYTIKKGYDNNIYIGSDTYGITIYDPTLGKFTPWEKIKGTEYNKDFFRIYSILPCKDSSIFVGYLHGLTHLKVLRDPSGNFRLSYLHEYKNDNRFLNLGNNAISSLLQNDNWILAGYRYAGLVLLNKKSGKSINILRQNYIGSLPSNNITFLYLDGRNRLWIGTDFGLNWIDFNALFNKSPHFHCLSMENGLPGDIIHGIEEDNNHFLWVSTNKGLAKINPNTFRVIQYRGEDGLQNDEFSDGAVWKDNRGKLYFGGISGFNHFDPQNISVDKDLPNLLISDLTFGGQTTAGIRLTVLKPFNNLIPKEYNVQRDQNFFHLKIEPANGFVNIKFQSKYILKSFDDQWHDVNGNSRIEYSNLPPGSYNFFVKWSNGQGEWTTEKKVFHVEIAQYFLLSIWAKIIYLLIISVFIYLIYKFRKSRSEIKNKLLVENIVRVKEQKLYEEKVNFFTNITHELQTPLTLILGAIDRFFYQNKDTQEKNKNFKFLRIANQEAFRLQYLVHQVLEFRKAESGHAKLSLNTFNTSNLIKNIAELFGPLKDQKSINFSLIVEENILVCSDKDKFETIIFNLFSNAFKHSAPGENISCEFKLADNKRHIQLSVSNSGFQSGNMDLSFLFEQFYTIDDNKNTKESSGIGLALTKQLTEILGGNITAKTNNNWIIFDLQFPVNKNDPDTPVLSNSDSLSDKPSYLVRSIVESMEITEDSIVQNNDLALIENFEVPGKKSVLVVEDDNHIRLLLKEVLLDEYVVYEAKNGKNAIQVLKKIIPNLIISDVLMNDMDGLTLCSLVKNDIETCHIPFLLLSARGSAEHKLEGFEAGADGYMTKPYSPASLLKKIKELIDYKENVQQFLHKDQYYQSINHNGLKPEDQTFLRGIIKVINEHLSNSDLDATVVEKELSLSRMSLYRKLKALTNMTPSEFIKHLRLRHAATLLKTTNLTVSEIYYQTGFNNQSYFYREFKKAYHSSPKEFKEQQQIDTMNT
jgi:signal transduction histidine kinase/DNA-binding response OmpR family regulator